MNDRALSMSAHDVLQAADTGQYTAVSAGGPSHQDAFSSALCALGWARSDPDRAWSELELVLGMRAPGGRLAHMAYDHGGQGVRPGPAAWGRRVSADGRRISALAAFPVAGVCVAELAAQCPDERRVRALLPLLHASHQFLLTDRSHHGDREPVLVHPWESGRPGAPEWDGPLRAAAAECEPGEEPFALLEQGRAARWRQAQLANLGAFRVLDPGFTAALAASCADVAALATGLGEERLAAESEMLAYAVSRALWARAGTDGLVAPVDLNTGMQLGTAGAASALAVLAPSVPADSLVVLRGLLLDGELACPFGVRSGAADERAPWRGAAHAPLTWLCALGLERHGERAAAGVLRGRLLDGAVASGLREGADARTGKGVGSDGCAVTAALALHVSA